MHHLNVFHRKFNVFIENLTELPYFMVLCYLMAIFDLGRILDTWWCCSNVDVISLALLCVRLYPLFLKMEFKYWGNNIGIWISFLCEAVFLMPDDAVQILRSHHWYMKILFVRGCILDVWRCCTNIEVTSLILEAPFCVRSYIWYRMILFEGGRILDIWWSCFCDVVSCLLLVYGLISFLMLLFTFWGLILWHLAFLLCVISSLMTRQIREVPFSGAF
jgi:hypothetical protein